MLSKEEVNFLMIECQLMHLKFNLTRISLVIFVLVIVGLSAALLLFTCRYTQLRGECVFIATDCPWVK